jgi:hypothetical protein
MQQTVSELLLEIGGFQTIVYGGSGSSHRGRNVLSVSITIILDIVQYL